MDNKLPPSKVFVENIVAGNISVLRLPKGTIRPGDIITAKAPGIYQGTLRLGVKNVEYPLLHSITVEEAEQEGYHVPDFCPTKNLCENIESRIDFESLVFDQGGDTPVNRSREDVDTELYERLKAGCSTCVIKKDAKDLFLSWWKTAYHETENKEIAKVTFEVISRS